MAECAPRNPSLPAHTAACLLHFGKTLAMDSYSVSEAHAASLVLCGNSFTLQTAALALPIRVPEEMKGSMEKGPGGCSDSAR